MPEARFEDHAEDQALSALLVYPEAPPDEDFTLRVMQRVMRERRRRRAILGFAGTVGAAFGLAGAWLLSEPIQALFSGLPLTGTMQAVLALTAAVAFYGWVMNEDVSLAT